MATSLLFLLLLLVLSPTVLFAKDINVGDNNGWTNSFDYSTWASSQTFNVGDKLVFTYGFTHSLDEVSKDDYDNCNTGSPINSYTSSPATITLSKPGPMYFICPISNHCSQGMKLAVNVMATSGGGSSTPSPPSSTTPSPPSETTPSPPGSPTTPERPRSPPSTSSPPTPTGDATSILGGFSHLIVALVMLFVFMA